MKLSGSGIRTVLGILVVSICITQTESVAQIIHAPGMPHSWGQKSLQVNGTIVELPPLPKKQTERIHKIEGPNEGAFEWGVQRSIKKDVFTNSQLSLLPDGRHRYLLRIKSPGAKMMSLYFSRFDLLSGTEVYVYDNMKSRYIGPLLEENELPSGTMSTAVLPGDDMVVEVIRPGNNTMDELVLESIVHGVIDVFERREKPQHKDYSPGFDSQYCNVNVACPVASPWQDQKRAVAMFLNNDGWGCNGVMLNNTALDGTPYFQVANHCYTTQTPTWVFYWNYESPTCVGDTGQTMQTQVGGAHVASDFYKDFALLQLYNTPPASYNVYYAGWDATGSQPSTQTVIHHPYYDVKKIAFDYDPAGSYTNSYGTNLWSCTWEQGIVEFFSSGGPLFDQNKRVIGLMTEGANACFNVQNEVTGCAKFHEMWTGATPQERFSDHLDPLNSGVLVLDGFDPNAPAATSKLNLKVFLEGPFDEQIDLMNDDIRAAGLLPVEEPYSALGFSLTGGGGEETSSALLASSGGQAIVDWVVVELRDKNDITNVLFSKALLLRRDGMVVDEGGLQPEIPVGPDDFYVTVRHRNHLPITTAQVHSFSPTTSLLDLTDQSVQLHATSMSRLSDNARLMMAGDATGDMNISYSGAGNDRDAILNAIGGGDPTVLLSGYHLEDCNLDGQVRYSGLNNDRDLILVNIGGSNTTAVVTGGLP